MFHCNEYVCNIGITALQKKWELQQVQDEQALVARIKDEVAFMEKKRKYDEVVNLQINDDSQPAQLCDDQQQWCIIAANYEKYYFNDIKKQIAES